MTEIPCLFLPSLVGIRLPKCGGPVLLGLALVGWRTARNQRARSLELHMLALYGIGRSGPVAAVSMVLSQSSAGTMQLRRDPSAIEQRDMSRHYREVRVGQTPVWWPRR